MLVKAKDEAVKRMNKIISANNTNLLKTDKKYLTPLDFEIKEECVCNSVDDAKKLLQTIDKEEYNKMKNDLNKTLNRVNLLYDALILEKVMKIFDDDKSNENEPRCAMGYNNMDGNIFAFFDPFVGISSMHKEIKESFLFNSIDTIRKFNSVLNKRLKKEANIGRDLFHRLELICFSHV